MNNLEQSLIDMWEATQTIQGCGTVVKILSAVSDYVEDEELDTVLFCQNLAFAKGNALRIIENQRAFVGEL